MRTVAIVQARMMSTRLPKKVMRKIVGKPMIWHVVNRVKEAKAIDEIVIATSTAKENNEIIRFAERNDINWYAGSEDDVLDRFYHVAKKSGAKIIVRITADNPFTDPVVIDKLINFYLKNRERVDYVSNTIEQSYPDGLDVEVFSFDALEKAWKEAKKKSEREHVTPYVWNNPDKFRLTNILYEGGDLSYIHCTVDNSNDLKFAREVYRRLYNEKRIFLLKDIVELLEKQPELTEINKNSIRYEGYLKSLKED